MVGCSDQQRSTAERPHTLTLRVAEQDERLVETLFELCIRHRLVSALELDVEVLCDEFGHAVAALVDEALKSLLLRMLELRLPHETPCHDLIGASLERKDAIDHRIVVLCILDDSPALGTKVLAPHLAKRCELICQIQKLVQQAQRLSILCLDGLRETCVG